jgi:HEAT repeat protein
VAQAIGAIGPEARAAVPVLRRFMNYDHDLPWATAALARIAPSDPDLVPALTALLRYQNVGDRLWSAEELGRLGPAARAAVPYLEAIFREEEPRLHGKGNENYWRAHFVMTVAGALLRITGDEKRLVPVLLHGARSHHKYSVLGGLAADHPWAMSALLEALRSSDRGIQSEAIEALAQAGSAAKVAVPELTRLLRAEMDRPRPRLGAGPILLAMILPEPDARQVDELFGRDRLQSLSSTLAAIGPDARVAAPLLREIQRRQGSSGFYSPSESDLLRIEGSQP